jgi:hypothetical protein
VGNGNVSEESLRKQAWDYFQMHAGQRLSTFNFYIVISSVLSTALFTSFQKDYRIPGVSVILGFLLAFFSFIFWKLDVRNKELIKNAEAALKFFESTRGPADSDEGVHVTKLFLHEEYHTDKKRSARYFFLWRRYWSYSDCFNLVFLAFECVGLSGIVVGLI